MTPMILDCFAGGGGASVGIEMALGRRVDVAINHDPQAILMHKTNHPGTLHLTEDIFKVDLPKYVKGRHVALMWASPDCTSHSKAKGGKPRNSGLRILPWAVYKHAKAILPDVIIMENVEERVISKKARLPAMRLRVAKKMFSVETDLTSLAKKTISSPQWSATRIYSRT